MKIMETSYVKSALKLVEAVEIDRHFGGIGVIEGEPGTGKSQLARHIAEKTGGTLITCWSNITNKGLLAELVEVISGLQFSFAKSTEGRFLQTLKRIVHKDPEVLRWLIVDEVNHLGWPHLETLRFLADELNFCVLLVGTQLPDQPANEKKATLLGNQLASRIGGKRIRLEPLSMKETAAYILRPRFGDVAKPVAEAFYDLSGGFWRNALAAATTCERIVESKKFEVLNLEAVGLAAKVIRARRASK